MTTTEVASLPVRMSPDLMEHFASRDTRGRLQTWDWGQPDADGFYTPTVTTHEDDNLVAFALALLRERVERLQRHACEPCEPDPEGWRLERDDVLAVIDRMRERT